MLKLALAKTIPLNRPSIFDGIVLYEPVNATLLDKCINSDLLVTNYNDPKWFKNEKTHLENYAKTITQNFARVEYKRKEGFPIGRFNPRGRLGLHSIRRQTRHTLVKGLMRDMDMKNCHNELLIQLLIYNNYSKICAKKVEH